MKGSKHELAGYVASFRPMVPVVEALILALLLCPVHTLSTLASTLYCIVNKSTVFAN